MFRVPALLLPLALAVPLAGCAGLAKVEQDIGLSKPSEADQRRESDLAASRVTTIGVNAYLWRAALDTLSFMPLAQVDSNGGVIVTDWYANPQTPAERMKLTVSVLDQDLRADAVRVAASRQLYQANQWVDAPVQAATVQDLEEIILSRARDLRRTAVGG